MIHKKGFTLVEMLFVVAIIGIILALLAPALVTVKKRALAVQCAWRLHNIAVALEAYSTANDGIIPYIAMGPEAQTHPDRLYHPATGVPSLSHFLEQINITSEEARCPADTGCAGQSYYPTAPGRSCFEGWGQSMLYNSSCYREPKGPGYTSDLSGPLHGAKPIPKETIRQPSTYLLTSDFWAHWHFGIGGNSADPYYTNILYFDGHVDGKRYATEHEGMAYLSWDGVLRWWIPDPDPFMYPE